MFFMLLSKYVFYWVIIFVLPLFIFYLYFLLVLFVLRFVCNCGIILIVRYYTNESINVPVHRSVPRYYTNENINVPLHRSVPRYYTNESINVPVHRSVPDVKLESVMNDYSDIIIMPGRNYDRLNNVTMFFY